MRAKDITPGDVYAYQERAGEPVRPIVFLAPMDRNHLYIKSRTPGRAFHPAAAGSEPRAGTVYNSGTVGYPAAIGTGSATVADMRAITLDRFKQATSVLGRRCEYTLVTRLARVIGRWEEFAPDSPKED
ncbi:hypothetical protein [Nonomuraea sp. NPDC001023]|uniref:hypothetical protein n=1 Tax=unclassified Nonomuraea TaxID=2593643 RepID=UPI0033319C63